MLRWVAVLVAAGLTALGASGAAEPYPAKPVRILTTVIGGSLDLTARFIAPRLSESLGQPVIVDNRGEHVAIYTVAKAAPDGHTLVLASASLWLLPFLRAGVPWDPVRDFSPVTLAVTLPNIIAVHPSLPVRSLVELIALAKARPGELSYSSGQPGSSSHLAGELFKSLARVNIVHVPYKGGGPAILALVSGEVQVSFPNAGSAAPHIQSARMRALAVVRARPSALLPGLPAAGESGLPGFETGALLAIFAPAKTPAAIVNRLNKEIVQILNRPDVKQQLFDSGAEVVASSPADLAAVIKTDMTVTGKLIKDVGIRAD